MLAVLSPTLRSWPDVLGCLCALGCSLGADTGGGPTAGTGSSCNVDDSYSGTVEWRETTPPSALEPEEVRCATAGGLIGGSSADGLLAIAEPRCADGVEIDRMDISVFDGTGETRFSQSSSSAATAVRFGFSFDHAVETPQLMFLSDWDDAATDGMISVRRTDNFEERWSVAPSGAISAAEYPLRSISATADMLVVVTDHRPEFRGEVWVFHGLADGAYALEDASTLHVGRAEYDDVGQGFQFLDDLDGDGLEDAFLKVGGVPHLWYGADLNEALGLDAAVPLDAAMGPGSPGIASLGDIDGDGYAEFSQSVLGESDETYADVAVLGKDGRELARIDVAPATNNGVGVYWVGDADGVDGPEAMLVESLATGKRRWVAHMPNCGIFPLEDVAVDAGLPTYTGSGLVTLDVGNRSILVLDSVHESDAGIMPLLRFDVAPL